MSISRNTSGVSLVEIIIAIFLLSIGVLSVMAIQPNMLRTAAQTDYVGRAAGVLASELQKEELTIMNGDIAVTLKDGTTPTYVTSGNITYTVSTVITSAGTNIWTVRTTISWPGNTKGVTASILVARQNWFTPSAL